MESPQEERVERFFTGTGSSYDWIVLLGTVGFDLWWKEKILRKFPSQPKKVIDQASGTGILTFKIARHFPLCQVIGVELRREYLDIARRKGRALQLPNVEFVQGRAEEVFLRDKFDCIVSSYLAKYAALEPLICHAQRMLRRGGLLLLHDFIYPPNPNFGRLWMVYFQLLQTLGSKFYPEWKTVFFELPGFLRQTRWIFEAIPILRRYRFAHISLELPTLGSCAIVTATNS